MDEAIIYCFEENIMPFFKKFDTNVFRINKLYKKTCDIALKNHWQTLKDIYTRASAMDALPDADSVMSINEFTNLVIMTTSDEGLNLTMREIGPLFNLSMMTQVDEINSERHCQMMFLEFVEAMCRVADRVISLDKSKPTQNDSMFLSLPPVGKSSIS